MQLCLRHQTARTPRSADWGACLVIGAVVVATACRPQRYSPPAMQQREIAQQTTASAAETKPRRISAVGRQSLGTNLAPISDWSAEWAFVDIFVRARPFVTASWETAGPEVVLEQDENGWPERTSGELKTVLGYPAGTPPGVYAITWRGDPSLLSVEGAASRLRCHDGKPVTSCPSRLGHFDMAFSADRDTAVLSIAPLSRERRVHDVRVITPGGVCGRSPADLDLLSSCQSKRGGSGLCPAGLTCFDLSQVAFNRFTDPPAALSKKPFFHPRFLDDLRHYGALRFMDWQRTNNSPVRSEVDRATLKMPFYSTERGAPVEVAIGLANVLRADPWINVPHQADQGFVSGLARLVHEQLSRDLNVYVEYSNETWNGMFTQSEHVVARGRAERPCAPGLEEGGPPDDWGQGRCYHLERSQSAARAFEAAFGAERDRVIGVLGSWAANDWSTRLMLKQLAQRHPRDSAIDAVAIAPYIGGYLGEPQFRDTVARFTPDDLFAELRSGGKLRGESVNPEGALADAITAGQKHAALASEFQLKLLAYEGGQHLAGVGEAADDPRITELFMRANGDPRMYDLYRDYLSAWKGLGGGVFFHYYSVGAASRHGCWGSKQRQDEPLDRAPKFRALLDFVGAQ